MLLAFATVVACSTSPDGSSFPGTDASCAEAGIKHGCPCTEPGALKCGTGKGFECSSAGTWRFFSDNRCDPPDPWLTPTPDADTPLDARAASDAADAGDCPADPGAALGKPCPKEGQFCGSCGNPCQFCSVIRCERGTWGRVEVPPAPCDAGADG